MKNFLCCAVIMILFFTCVPGAYAWPWGKKEPVKSDTSSAPVKSESSTMSKTNEKGKAASGQEKANKDEEAAKKAKRALIEQKRKEINNIEWEIQLNPLSGKGNPMIETAIFRNMQVYFTEFGKKGFTASNFSLKIQEDKVIVWETMQSSEKSGVAFWRGEISPDLQKMRGVVSYQADNKKKDDYSFISTKRRQLE